MPEAGRAAAAEADVPIESIEASSFDLGSHLGMFRTVTIGRALHWMDRSDALRRLNTLIEPNGARVLFTDVRPDVPESIWHKHYAMLIDRYSSMDARIPADRLRHEAILPASPFNLLEWIGAIERRLVPLERLVDRALSISTSSPEQLGALRDRLAQQLMDQMNQFATY